MTPSPDIVAQSYAFCRRMSERAGSSFHVGFRLLPPEKRRAMDALYAFMRHTDDLADNAEPAHSRRAALTLWWTALEDAMLGDSSGEGVETQADADLAEKWTSPPANETGAAILPALVDAVQRFEIPEEHLSAVIEGVEMDLDRRRYDTFDELQVYCQRVASAVGLACIYVWGFRGPAAFEPARQAGVAFQLTNILRDLKEDAAADRIYLPREDLRECGYSEEELLAGVTNKPFLRLIKLEVDRAEQCYRDAAELLKWLEPDGQRIFGLMTATYHALLRKIARRPNAVLQGHVRLGGLKRLQLAARWTLLPPGKGAGR